MAGRKTKFDIENSNKGKVKIWTVAEYIRLSQEDEGIRRRQAGKQQYNKSKSAIAGVYK